MAYQRITLSELKGLAMKRLGNVLFWDQDTEIVKYLNEALRTWNLMTGQWKGQQLMLTVLGQTLYSTTLLKVMRVSLNDLALDQTSLFGLDQGHPGWQADTGVPVCWFPVGLTQIGLYPKDSVGNRSLKLEGLTVAPVLSADADYLDLGDWQVQPLLDAVQHLASFKQGGDEFKATMPLMQNFVTAAGIQNAKFKESGMYRRYMGADAEEQQKPIYKGASGGGKRQ